MNQAKNIISNNLLFVLAIWCFSRMVIGISMLLIAPLLATPSTGVAATVSWDVFYAFDSDFYEKIATHGYEYSVIKKQYSVAFFPLFPLFIRGLMSLGLPFKLAGILVNNLTFFGALIVLFSWIHERYGKNAARWTIAVLAWFPMSLFGTVIYFCQSRVWFLCVNFIFVATRG
ncbi:hypothetical protein [Cylindrospermum sp. FACHB-282]|uniref:hypothetical protein n=1 Tax=Cylindrospermum sp. FACHB-282 TaxID=2692794 RepID=UPI0028163F3F|nr:hypothetical protein [Cylindrospermum sp. FACHB-282]